MFKFIAVIAFFLLSSTNALAAYIYADDAVANDIRYSRQHSLLNPVDFNQQIAKGFPLVVNKISGNPDQAEAAKFSFSLPVVIAKVPEPSSIILLVIGLLSVIKVRRTVNSVK